MLCDVFILVMMLMMARAAWLIICRRDWKLTLLTELGLTLLDGSDDHVTGGGGRETVKTSTNAVDGNDEKVLGT